MNYLYISQIAQIIVTVVLIVLVLIQSKGGGLSSAFGGSFTFYRSKRGVERSVFVLTIILGIFLAANSLIIVYLS
jgi:preprotein translocase subunit SecG